MEQYDYVVNKWTVLQVHMAVARSFAPAACTDRRIFIVGGVSESSVECFDPVEKRFSNVAALSQPRYDSAAASVRVSTSVLKRLFESATGKS